MENTALPGEECLDADNESLPLEQRCVWSTPYTEAIVILIFLAEQVSQIVPRPYLL